MADTRQASVVHVTNRGWPQNHEEHQRCADCTTTTGGSDFLVLADVPTW